MERYQKATFGAGCFWHTEEDFRKLPGVKSTAVGFMGGKMDNPSYREVCSGKTGHAEVCQIEFDPKKISYQVLLDVFFRNHDPTQVDRQGPDIGKQYRSVIFYLDPGQKSIAEAEIMKRMGQYKKPITTAVEKAQAFWKAEEYHQKYLMARGLESCSL
jgi:peptide-methionine (S)-S-oxide reductase